MLKFLRLTPFALIAACGSHSGVSTSGLEWAHYQPDAAYGGPLGRIEALKQGFAADYDAIKICVETGKKTIADANLILESKLAYAAWLSGAGYDATDWAKYEFSGAAKCHANDGTFAGFIALVDPANHDPGEDQTTQFQPEHITCTNNGQEIQCQSSSTVLGWGGPGNMTYYYQSNNANLWTKLTSYAPSSTTLSPYLDWQSFDQDLARNTAAGLTDAAKASLLASYNALLASPSPSFADLTAFVKDLSGAQLVTSDDPVFTQLMATFNSGTSTKLDQDYRGQRGVLSTIVHEVGHQYGMDHAHQPQHESITGSAGDATQKNGQWVTDKAAMAYGLPYMYLTDDDTAGIKDDAASIKAFLAQHK